LWRILIQVYSVKSRCPSSLEACSRTLFLNKKIWLRWLLSPLKGWQDSLANPSQTQIAEILWWLRCSKLLKWTMKISASKPRDLSMI
jgi:hypothetical protein